MKEFFEKVWVKHTIIVIAILIAWQLGVKFLHQEAYSKAVSILQPRVESSKTIQKGISSLSTIDKPSLQKLQNLSIIVEDRKEEGVFRAVQISFCLYHNVIDSFVFIGCYNICGSASWVKQYQYIFKNCFFRSCIVNILLCLITFGI